MKKAILTFILICGIVSAQPVNYLDFLPLKVGNVWVYKWRLFIFMPPVNDSGFYKVVVSNTVVRNNRNYYTFNVLSGGCGATFGNIFDNNILRIDSVSGNVMKFDSVSYCSYSPYEKLIDSLKMRLLDSINYNCQTSFYRPYCSDTAWQNIFGSSRPSKSVVFPEIEAAHNKRFVKGIGISGFGYNASHLYQQYHCNYYLMGCVINGIVYGDTSMTGISRISSEVPQEFNLYQNYPNPFNPTTKIKFDIPPYKGGHGDVSLKVYDVLGREVATLVNEQLSPGTYETEFDGTNYPSGVYFYVFESGEFRQTKNMVLIK